MRQIQAKWLRDSNQGVEGHARLKVAIMSEVNLDNMRTLDGLRRLFNSYNHLPLEDRPSVFILIGNFVQKAVINGGTQAGSIEYKEYFDALATVLSEFSALLQRSTFVFVPGDNDPWASAFSAGAACTIPRQGVPELFTSRVKRAFTSANAEINRSQTSEPPGEAIWTSNPSRLTFFGPVHDIAILRDDISGRLRRSAVTTGQENNNSDTTMNGHSDNASMEMGSTAPEDQTEDQTEQPDVRNKSTPPAVLMARKLVKTILDQGTMSPFPLSTRPVLWDYAASLQLYPLPTSFILADAEAVPFCMTYEGCHVMNPGRLIPEGGSSVKWIEYDVVKNRGKVKEERL
jgi:DNA polymerase epsilon subunit 2